MASDIINEMIAERIEVLDKELSKRFIALDPNGYFLIKIDFSTHELIVEHYSNDIDSEGRALDPNTGKPLECKAERKRKPIQVFKGRSAKEIGIKITESESQSPVSKIDHALYLGRELQRAENCLLHGITYIQD